MRWNVRVGTCWLLATALLGALLVALPVVPPAGAQEESPSWLYSSYLGEIVAFRPTFGGGQEAVTDSARAEVHPSVGPDGTTLYVASLPPTGEAGTEQVVAIDLATGAQTVLVDGPGSRGAPTVTPDGATLIHREGTAIVSRPLTGATAGTTAGAATVLVDDHDLADHPDVHPDGTSITYTGANAGRSQVHVRDLATGAATTVAPGAYLQALYPEWSPDGARVWFSCQMAVGEPFEVCHAAPGDADVVVVPVTDPGWGPVFSPDGSRIAHRTAFGAITTSLPDGTDRRSIGYGLLTVAEQGLAWGPDMALPGLPAPPPAPSVPPPPPNPPPAPPTGIDGDPATTEQLQTLSSPLPIAVSEARFADVDPADPADPRATATSAVLATTGAFADSLAGSALTAAAPLLLVDRTRLDPRTVAELQRVLAPGSTVHLLGSETVISATIEREVADLGFVPVRLAGPTRFETAVAVAEAVVAAGGRTDVVLVARAFGVEADETSGWVDAIAVGAHAAEAGIPLLLTPTDSLHPTVQGWIEATGATPVLLGGTAAISDEVEAALPGAARVAGASRAGTAAAIAIELTGLPADGPRTTVLIDGRDRRGWQDGLAAAGLAADLGAAVLLLDGTEVPGETATLVSTCGDPEVETVVIGVSLSEALVEALADLDGGTCTR